jgi:hypothetical protein
MHHPPQVNPASQHLALISHIKEQQSSDISENKAQSQECNLPNQLILMSPRSHGQSSHHVRSQVCREQEDEPVPEWTEDVPAHDRLVGTRVLVPVKTLVLGFSDSHLDLEMTRRIR